MCIFSQSPIHLGLLDHVADMSLLFYIFFSYHLAKPCLSFVNQEINGPPHLMTDKEPLFSPTVSQGFCAKPMHSVNFRWGGSAEKVVLR